MPYGNSPRTERDATYRFNQIRALHLNKENTKIPENDKPETGISGLKTGPDTTEVISNTSIVSGPQILHKGFTDMSAGFIKFHRSKEFEEMVEHYPLAFVLLAVIAQRAKRTTEFSAIGLEVGEALLGDHSKYGLTRQQFRTCVLKLKLYGFLTIKSTTRGTIVKLLKNSIFDTNCEQQPTNEPTNSQPSNNHQTTTKKKERSKEVKKLYSSDSIEIGLCMKLFENLKVLEKSVKQPKDFTSWAIHMDRLIKLDGASAEEIEETIKWLHTSNHPQADFWKGQILSADGLRKKWSKVRIAMKQKAKEGWNKKPTEIDNERWAKKVHALYPEMQKFKEILLGHDYLEFRRKQEGYADQVTILKYSEPEFREQVQNNLEKHSAPLERLQEIMI